MFTKVDKLKNSFFCLFLVWKVCYYKFRTKSVYFSTILVYFTFDMLIFVPQLHNKLWKVPYNKKQL